MSTRSAVLAITDSALMRSYFTKRGLRSPLVRRFIAGEQLRDALLVVSEYQQRRIRSALDLLGENVLNEQEAAYATNQYKEVIKQVAIFSQEAYVSIKLSALGLDISEDLARANLRSLTDEARIRGGVFIRIDMEGSAYTQRTLDIAVAEHSYYQPIGTVLQSYLRRTDADLERMLAEGISVRLVKGAYAEPPHIAYPKKTDVDVAYRKQMYVLMQKGYNPALATQDEDIIKVAKRFAQQQKIPLDRFEFQMLLGIRRDLQDSLTDEGYRVRVYVPFGRAWYPYFTRRLAERPANIGFILKNLMRG